MSDCYREVFREFKYLLCMQTQHVSEMCCFNIFLLQISASGR
jgi:hypothetical protein